MEHRDCYFYRYILKSRKNRVDTSSRGKSLLKRNSFAGTKIVIGKGRATRVRTIYEIHRDSNIYPESDLPRIPGVQFKNEDSVSANPMSHLAALAKVQGTASVTPWKIYYCVRRISSLFLKYWIRLLSLNSTDIHSLLWNRASE